ncbi:MAG: aminotransferase class V-fold PLP-dependent enzyme [Clostridia bacterium]|nr:aminotransferase class V-fold PLP-dependent enzyme [Clostridia bacterium]
MIYLDNAATTKPIWHRSTELFFNSNMPYAIQEKEYLQHSEQIIKNFLGVKSGKVLYFRCATEAIEWLASKMKYVGCSKYEHDSVYNVANVKSIQYLRSNKSLYCVQLVNQITGDVQRSIAWDELDKWWFNGSDLTAAIGHIEMPKNIESTFDAVWFSGHKFHTEKNIGVMWISDKLSETLGASDDPTNQYGLVHGTVDVDGAIMIAKALEWLTTNQYWFFNHFNELYKTLTDTLTEYNIDAEYICNNLITKSKAINAVRLYGIDADSLATYLASKNIYIGVGHSACSDTSDYRVLNAFGYTDKTAKEVIRISFSFENTELDIHKLVEEIKNYKEKYV